MGSKQVKHTVCSLFVGDWRLCEYEGRMYMALPRWEIFTVEGKYVREGSHKWYVSAPTFKNHQGKFLSANPRERGPSVHLTTEKGGHTQWAFDFKSHLRPRRVDPAQLVYEGTSGSTFTMQMTEGKFKGWYLAVEDLTEDQKKRVDREPVYRPLKLVPSAKQAAIFTYVEERFRAE
jgi:hypothetical protein